MSDLDHAGHFSQLLLLLVLYIFVFKTSQLAEKEKMEKQIQDYVMLNTPRNSELKIFFILQ